MASNRYLEIKDAIDAARQRLSLIREGIIPDDNDDEFMPRSRRPRGVVHVRAGLVLGRGAQTIPFNIPATRSYRLTSPTGATSFHFSHRSIGKVTFATSEEGVRVKPGAARAHGRYVEREDAVAPLDPAVEPELTASVRLDSTADLPVTEPTQEHQHDYTYDERIDQWLGGGLVENLSALESGPSGPLFTGPLVGRPVEDPLTDARMWLLPRRDVVRHESRTHGLLRSATDVSVEAGTDPLGLRQPSPDHCDEGSRIDTPSLRNSCDAAGHDGYIERVGAVAMQPDGKRALLTNIDADDEERARFWSLVEEHEAVNRGDKMSLRIADNPDFWSAIATREDCPPELKAVLASASKDTTVRFAITSGKEMRAFLGTQLGWVPPGTEPEAGAELKPFAKFHDGRGGRTQYRIVGELPDELSATGRFGILREFSEQFTKRRLPFVAVMHAPDHKNDERNWHFHLIYYDRPCRRITSDDIAHLIEQGFRSEHLEPGMWDFAVVTPKKGRSNGKAVPLKQNKVAEVTQTGWIEMLREELATITNRHLALAGVDRRLDPRRYEEMGIVADPQEHLGTEQAAAETRGEPTVVGSENERRQWNAIMAEADARLDADLMAIDEQSNAAASKPDYKLADDKVRREQLAEAARLEHMAFCLEQDIDRARSRATTVQRKNRQLLDAYEVDPAAGTERERTETERLVKAAANYLVRLDEMFVDDAALPDLARQVADQARVSAGANAWPATATKVSNTFVHAYPQSTTPTGPSHAVVGEVDVAASRRREELAHPAPSSVQTDDEAGRVKRSEPQTAKGRASADVAKGEAAKQAAIAAAARGLGR